MRARAARRVPLSGRSVVVTGAASGIGARAVERLLDAGSRVAVSDVDPVVVERFADRDDVVAVVGDLSSPDVATEVVARAEQAFGPVDLLLHCAAIMPGGRVRDVDAAVARRVMEVNYFGTVHVTRAVLPSMRARRAGRIVVLGSLTGYLPTPGFSAYSASKAAVDSFVETLAHEERGSGVQVLLVAPNAVKTPLLEQASEGPAFVRRLITSDSSPLMITTDDVLDATERGLARGRTVVVPGGVVPYAARRLSPALTWRVVTLLDR